MSSLLVDRVAAITGGTRGIGRAIAEAFVAEGARVVINGRSVKKGELALSEMAAGDAVAFFPGSVTEKGIIEGLVDFTIEHFGQLDVMVLNAGGVGDSAPVVELTDEEWDFELALNLNHVFRGTRRALKHMIPRQFGRIIAISSIDGKHGRPNLAGYAANKHGINGFVKSTAREVGIYGVTVNSICPGLVLTDMANERAGKNLGLKSIEELVTLLTGDTALKRPVTPEEIGAFATYLASEMGGGFSGGTISLDGGGAYY